MKSIDVKSLLIGTLLASTIFLGVAATSPTDKWDDRQEWRLRHMGLDYSGQGGEIPIPALTIGYEPFAATDKNIFYRKRIK